MTTDARAADRPDTEDTPAEPADPETVDPETATTPEGTPVDNPGG